MHGLQLRCFLRLFMLHQASAGSCEALRHVHGLSM